MVKDCVVFFVFDYILRGNLFDILT